MPAWGLWSTLHAAPVAGGPSVNFSCVHWTLHHLSWTFCASTGLYVNFTCVRKLPSTFCTSMGIVPTILASAGHSVNFNFLCICSTFHQVLVHPRDIPSTFCASTGHSVNSRKLYVWPRNLPSTFEHSRNLLLTFRATVGPSVTFSQLSVRLWVFLSTFVNFSCGRGYSVNFLCVCTTTDNFHQLSVHPLVLPWTFLMATKPSVKFPWVCRTFHQLPSTFRASAVPFINFRQRFVHPRDLL